MVEWLTRRPLKAKIVGSNPTVPTNLYSLVRVRVCENRMKQMTITKLLYIACVLFVVACIASLFFVPKEQFQAGLS